MIITYEHVFYIQCTHQGIISNDHICTPSIKPVAMYHGFVVCVSVVSSENFFFVKGIA